MRPMLATAFRPHALDPATLLTSSPALIPSLMARDDVHTVIWERGLRQSYTELYNNLGVRNFPGSAATDFADIHRGANLVLEENGNVRIMSDSGGDITNAVKELLPEILYSDVKIMASLINAMSGKREMDYCHLFGQQGNMFYERSNEWHRDSGITLHMEVDEAVLELMNKSGSPEDVTMNNYDIIKGQPGDIIAFKSTIHRASSHISPYGRYAFALS